MTTASRALCDRVDLIVCISNPDGFGGFKQEWRKCATTWALVEPKYRQTGDVQSILLGHKNPQMAQYKITFNAVIKKKIFQRIQWKNHTLAILTKPVFDHQQRFAVCYATELTTSERFKYG